MSTVMFEGGPLGGQGAVFEEEGPPGGMGMGGPPPGGPPPPGGGAPQDEGALFSQILASARQLLDADSLSEENKLLLEQATTLIQKIKASEEREMNDAMSGKMSPGVMRKAAAGGGGGAPSGGGGY